MKTPCIYTTRGQQHTQGSTQLSDNIDIDFSQSLQNNYSADALRLSSVYEAIEPAHSTWTLNSRKEREILSHLESMPPTLNLPDYKISVSLGVGNDELRTALDALASLPSPEAERILAKPHINPFNGWIPLSTTMLMVELRNTFAYAFRQNTSREHLVDLALIIFSNTAQTLCDSQQYRSEEWYTSFSGPRLRWEVIGLLFSSWALGALQNKEHISQYRPRVLAAKFFDIMKSCITFCRAVKAENLLLLYLLYRTSIVSSILHGPNSKGSSISVSLHLTALIDFLLDIDFWRFHAETVSLAYSLRLHAMSDSSLQDLHTWKQSERRLFTAIYILDKTAATFSGRLPILASHYCSTTLPLDICNTTLLHGKPNQISDFLSLGVDEEGWNTEGKIYSTTPLRARGLIAQLREEILAIALNQRERNSLDLM
jgi:hypothetical protein